MTNRTIKYIQRRKKVLTETLSEIDALSNMIVSRENRRIGLAQHIQRNIEETMRLSDEELRLRFNMERGKEDSDPAHRKAEEVYNLLFKLFWDTDHSWTADTYYNIFPFKNESRPTIERHIHNYVETLIYNIPLNWLSQIRTRKMKQSLYRYLTRNKSHFSMAQELVEKMKKRQFVELVKIDKKYNSPEILRAKIDEKAYRDCVEAWDKTKEHFGITRL